MPIFTGFNIIYQMIFGVSAVLIVIAIILDMILSVAAIEWFWKNYDVDGLKFVRINKCDKSTESKITLSEGG